MQNKEKHPDEAWVRKTPEKVPTFDVGREKETFMEAKKDFADPSTSVAPAQQSRSEIEKIKAEHEAQIAELQLRITPESPPEVREQRRRDIQSSAMKISDLVGSAAKLLEESVDT